MNKASVTVFVVLVYDVGEKFVPTISAADPTWILNSPANRRVVEQMRIARKGTTDSAEVTLFENVPGSSLEDILLGVIDDIDLHHGKYSSDGGYNSVEVIGLKPSDRVRLALTEVGLTFIVDTPSGFRAARE